MRVGPSEPVCRERFQTAFGGCGQKPWWWAQKEKAWHGPGQVTGKKRTAREPLWKCRKSRDDVKTAGGLLLRDQAPTKPVYGRSGIRHEWLPELAKEAVERNVGT